MTQDAGICTATLGDVTTLIAITGDNCTSDANLVISQSLPVGSTLSNGDVVTVTVRDEWGNAATCDITVTITDNTAPSITVPANITVNATAGQCGAPVNFNVVFADNCGIASQGISHASGSTFPVGTTTITTSAADGAGNATIGVPFTITVLDNQAPSITCPAVVAQLNVGTGCTVALPNYITSATISDNCTGRSSLNPRSQERKSGQATKASP